MLRSRFKMVPIKNQTSQALRQFRANQDEVYAKFRRTLLELEQEEERLTSELKVIQERKANVHKSLEQSEAERKCLSQTSNSKHRYRSKYATTKIPQEEIIKLSDDELTKHINKVAVAHTLAKREGADVTVLDTLYDNLTRLRLERKVRKVAK
jgi:hypothetical protein